MSRTSRTRLFLAGGVNSQFAIYCEDNGSAAPYWECNLPSNVQVYLENNNQAIVDAFLANNSIGQLIYNVPPNELVAEAVLELNDDSTVAMDSFNYYPPQGQTAVQETTGITLGVVSQADAQGIFGGRYNCSDGNVQMTMVMVEDVTGDGIPEYVNIHEAIDQGWITGPMATFIRNRHDTLLRQILAMYMENFNLKRTGFFDSRASVDDIRPDELMAEFYLYDDGMGNFSIDMGTICLYDCVNWPGGWVDTYYTPVYNTYNPYYPDYSYNYGRPAVAIDLNGDYYPDVIL